MQRSFRECCVSGQDQNKYHLGSEHWLSDDLFGLSDKI
jgi:hypothetical protein